MRWLRRVPLVLGIVCLVAAAIWKPVIQPRVAKFPTKFDASAHATGTFTLFLNPATAAPLATPTRLPLDIRRSLHVLTNESGSTRMVVDETDNQTIGDLKTRFLQRYVINRRSLRNVDDTRAFTYVPTANIDRSPYWSVNLALHTSPSKTYGIWKNEVNRSYPFSSTGTGTLQGLDVVRLQGTLRGTPISSVYFDQLRPLGLPDSLTLQQLQPQLARAGVDLNATIATLTARLRPEDFTTVTQLAARPIGLQYVLDVTTRLVVDRKTGGIVNLASIVQTIAARPDPRGLSPLLLLLSRYPSDPALQAIATQVRALGSAPATPVFTIDYSQTDASVRANVELAKDEGAKLDLAERWLPLGLLIAGVVLVVVGILVWPRRPRQRETREPVLQSGA